MEVHPIPSKIMAEVDQEQEEEQEEELTMVPDFQDPVALVEMVVDLEATGA